MGFDLKPSEIESLADALPREPGSVVRFKHDFAVAIYDPTMLAWAVSGSARAWGNPIELISTFGPYVVIDVGPVSGNPEEGERYNILATTRGLKTGDKIIGFENRQYRGMPYRMIRVERDAPELAEALKIAREAGLDDETIRRAFKAMEETR